MRYMSKRQKEGLSYSRSVKGNAVIGIIKEDFLYSKDIDQWGSFIIFMYCVSYFQVQKRGVEETYDDILVPTYFRNRYIVNY